MAEEKRVRRGFGTIILQKFDDKSKNIDPKKYQQFRSKLETLIGEFEKLQTEAKESRKANKRKYNALKKFTKEELMEYIKSC